MYTTMVVHSLAQVPVVVVYLVGVILAIVFWSRCPVACLFTLAGSGMLLLMALLQFESGTDHDKFLGLSEIRLES